jgi:hypothetical protein
MSNIINNNRNYHESSEKIMSNFLVKHFYSKIENSEYEIVTDKSLQVQGVDTILTIGDKKYFIDEKCSIMWRKLKTFSFELSTYNKTGTDVFVGWFLNDKLLTTHYLLIWVDETDVDEINDNSTFKTENKIKNIDSFKNVTIALVEKEKIKEHLSSIGWDTKNLFKKDYNIRYKNDKNFGNMYKNGCKFAHKKGNPKMPEEPVNILLPRQKLIDLSEITKTIIIE